MAKSKENQELKINWTYGWPDHDLNVDDKIVFHCFIIAAFIRFFYIVILIFTIILIWTLLKNCLCGFNKAEMCMYKERENKNYYVYFFLKFLKYNSSVTQDSILTTSDYLNTCCPIYFINTFLFTFFANVLL